VKEANVLGRRRSARQRDFIDEVLPVDHELDHGDAGLYVVGPEDHLPSMPGNGLVLDEVSAACTPIIHSHLQPIQSRLEYGHLGKLRVPTCDVNPAGSSTTLDRWEARPVQRHGFGVDELPRWVMVIG
jgi:hypothetical protein